MLTTLQGCHVQAPRFHSCHGHITACDLLVYLKLHISRYPGCLQIGKLIAGYNYTKAGITAIAAAHGVLFLYIYVAIKEDAGDRELKKRQ